MANANQVIINGKTILDLRSDTVTPETLQKGYTAHDKSGTKITGTLDVASGGGGGAGFSVTFPATATNWNNVSNGCGIVQADGTVVNMRDYSTLAGKTIPNVIEICICGVGFYFPRMTVQTGKIMFTYVFPGGVRAIPAVDGESSIVYMGNGVSARWLPLADTVISAIELQNTD